ncbi:MAG: isopeptide-forming domain-containing fimbrial protein [Oscillospiraceae bacterium]|nr:isopeptide-forming domain-containing fimbrial protein [Oscillospiraceae bacterium]
MKTMRKLLAMALVLMLALTLVPTALADETGPKGGTIQVTATGSTAVTKYTVYQIFSIEIAPGGGYKYRLTDTWKDFTAPSFFTVNANGYVTWLGEPGSHSDAAALAQLAKQYVNDEDLTKEYEVDVNGTVAVPNNGYYLLIPDVESPCGAVSVVGGATQTVTVKTEEKELPYVVKQVREDSTGVLGSVNHADVGQTIEFHTMITAGSDASHYILHDKMDECFDMGSITSVTRDGNVVPASYYTVDENPTCTNGCTFHVVFSEDFCANLTKNALIAVNYTASLKGNAKVDTPHTNTTVLTYTEQNVPTEESKTSTYTYKITVNKVDQKEQPLAGAGFMLKDNVGKYYYQDSVTGHVQWLTKVVADNGAVTWEYNGEPVEYAATEYKTDDTGIIEFYGVDAEVFTLEESTIPDGYTGQLHTQVITKAYKQGDTDYKDGSREVTIKNILGTALPETGGMGTTLFYLVGGLMVVAAVVLLVTKKRMRAAE